MLGTAGSSLVGHVRSHNSPENLLMSSPQSILVALDFSPPSIAAVEHAFELAAKFGATVHLLHVFTLQGKSESVAFSAERESERALLDSAANAHRDSGRLGEVLWREGDPAAQIALTAEQQRVDLIALGASGRTGMQRLVLGSVAESVVKTAPCNVLVIRR
jgi:nucleotide-binding universal stress UspA family protein